ncbi:histidine kinase, partial [Streptomyces sp. T-3]|nr:histidine kinase [Streptomyces sp. T-3]
MSAAAPSPAARSRVSPAAVRSRLADALLWAGLAVPALAADRLGLNEPRAAWQELAGLAVLAVAAAVWQARPLGAVLLVGVLGLAASPSLFTVSYGIALAVFCQLLGARGPAGMRPVLYSFAALALAGTVRIAVRDVDPVAEWLILLATLLFGCCFPWLVGRHRRQRRELAVAALARAAQLERARIAQDMHDSLGHDLSLIALRAGGLQVAADLPEAHRAAAASLRLAAADATERLREIVGLLREPGEGAPLAPAGETVAALVERASASGLSVSLDESGSPRGGLAERTVYRVVQEGLTNAAKYAPGARVSVAVEWGSAETTVVVEDDGYDLPVRAEEGGTGLVGLRERVLDAGGLFEAGAQGVGFRVRVVLPSFSPLPAPSRPRRQPLMSQPAELSGAGVGWVGAGRWWRGGGGGGGGG